ncbi:DUF1795 domain-containing protein [Ralstonia solanacearum]|uniref:DUF1795 domain-containing protein n=1 Tax=Ralstonia solanacearum TaxID=305 RepID=UPI000BE78B9A|nr:DUF1795 domain-containing protein [Ralstonia solanacearum]ATJ88279.1 hypothetical protein CDC59_18535 [Ralstonia solanacearum]
MHNDTDRIHFHEGSIALPPGFEDRTTNLFVPADPATQPNLSVARDWLKDGEALAAYVDRQLGVLKARMPGHRLLSRQAEQLGPDARGLDGERIDATYRSGSQTIRQRQAVFVVAPRRALIFTASSPAAFDEAFEAFWRAWLGGYRSPDSPPDSSPNHPD